MKNSTLDKIFYRKLCVKKMLSINFNTFTENEKYFFTLPINTKASRKNRVLYKTVIRTEDRGLVTMF